MKCPKCSYEDQWVTYDAKKDRVFHEGLHGAFWQLPLTMRREGGFYRQEMDIYGCPACKELFYE